MRRINGEEVIKTKNRDQYSRFVFVAPTGIEPVSSESESEILSIKLRSQ